MKTLVVMLSLILPMAAQAEVADFNALINENNKAQATLHEGLVTSVEETRLALEERAPGEPIVVEVQQHDVNVPTDKKFLRFKKEIVNHQASDGDLKKRLANEFESVDMEF